MTDLTTRDREHLKPGDFAYIDARGERHLPIHDVGHVRNAIARWSQTNFESAAARDEARRRILRAARDFGIAVDDDDAIKQDH